MHHLQRVSISRPAPLMSIGELAMSDIIKEFSVMLARASCRKSQTPLLNLAAGQRPCHPWLGVPRSCHTFQIMVKSVRFICYNAATRASGPGHVPRVQVYALLLLPDTLLPCSLAGAVVLQYDRHCVHGQHRRCTESLSGPCSGHCTGYCTGSPRHAVRQGACHTAARLPDKDADAGGC